MIYLLKLFYKEHLKGNNRPLEEPSLADCKRFDDNGRLLVVISILEIGNYSLLDVEFFMLKAI